VTLTNRIFVAFPNQSLSPLTRLRDPNQPHFRVTLPNIIAIGLETLTVRILRASRSTRCAVALSLRASRSTRCACRAISLGRSAQHALRASRYQRVERYRAGRSTQTYPSARKTPTRLYVCARRACPNLITIT
jgi:hypothetical protein